MLFHKGLFTLKYFFLATLIFISAQTLLAQANEYEYTEYKVLNNDTITTILKRHSLRPIYGKNGSLVETLRLNPKKQSNKGDLIYVGEVLLIPKKDIVNNTLKNNKIADKEVKSSPVNIDNPQKAKISQPTKKKPLPVLPPGKDKPINKEKKSTQNRENINQIPPSPLKENSKSIMTKPKLENKQERHDVFVPQKETKKEKVNTFTTAPSTSLESDSKTQLTALPIKTKTSQKLESHSEQEKNNEGYMFFMESEKFCNPEPMCKIWIWEQNIKCCRPVKQYFIFFEQNSL